MPRKRTPKTEREIRRLRAEGYSFREIGRIIECSDSHAHRVCMLRDELPPDNRGWTPAPGRLSMREREEIRAGTRTSRDPDGDRQGAASLGVLGVA